MRSIELAVWQSCLFWHVLAENETHLFGSVGCRKNSLWEEKSCPKRLGLNLTCVCDANLIQAKRLCETPTCTHKTHSYFPLQNPSSTVFQLLSCTSVHHLLQILGSGPGLMESSHCLWRNSLRNLPHPSCQTCSPSSQGMPPHPFGNHQCLCHSTSLRWPDHPT